jgi:hypothetical protein
MKKSIRLALLCGACFLGLAVAAPALAAYRPVITVEQTSYKLAAATTVDVFLGVPPTDDATAKVTIFAPAGYKANLGAAPGTKIGKVLARVKATQLAGIVLPLAGDVLVANPSDPAIQAAAAQCTPGVTNQTIWVLRASLQGQQLTIPVFVNTVGPYLTQTVCFSPPQTAAVGAQLVSADFTVERVFSNAGSRGGYEWAALFTPYLANGSPNPAGTVQWRTYVGLPSSLTLKRTKADKGIKFSGRLFVEGLSPKGVSLDIYAGKKPAPAPSATSANGTGKRVGRTGKLPESGKYALQRGAVKFATFFQVRFEGYVTTECSTPLPGLPPVKCSGESVAPVTSNQVKVLKPKPKKKHR